MNKPVRQIKKYLIATIGRILSPLRQIMSPQQRSMSPQQRSMSPQQRSMSPQRMLGSICQCIIQSKQAMDSSIRWNDKCKPPYQKIASVLSSLLLILTFSQPTLAEETQSSARPANSIAQDSTQAVLLGSGAFSLLDAFISKVVLLEGDFNFTDPLSIRQKFGGGVILNKGQPIPCGPGAGELSDALASRVLVPPFGSAVFVIQTVGALGCGLKPTDAIDPTLNILSVSLTGGDVSAFPFLDSFGFGNPLLSAVNCELAGGGACPQAFDSFKFPIGTNATFTIQILIGVTVSTCIFVMESTGAGAVTVTIDQIV